MHYFTLGHVYQQVGIVADESQFQLLMEEIKKLQCEVEGELTSSIAKLKQEVNSVQEKTSHELAQKITKFSYQFKHKGNKIQYNFNSEIEESISTAKSKWKNQKLLKKRLKIIIGKRLLTQNTSR